MCVVRFVTTLNPNPSNCKPSAANYWPRYTQSSPKILEFLDGSVPLQVAEDTYRQAALAYDTDASIYNAY